jgi:hypothetical protein
MADDRESKHDVTDAEFASLVNAIAHEFGEDSAQTAAVAGLQARQRQGPMRAAQLCSYMRKAAVNTEISDLRRRTGGAPSSKDGSRKRITRLMRAAQALGGAEPGDSADSPDIIAARREECVKLQRQLWKTAEQVEFGREVLHTMIDAWRSGRDPGAAELARELSARYSISVSRQTARRIVTNVLARLFLAMQEEPGDH